MLILPSSLNECYKDHLNEQQRVVVDGLGQGLESKVTLVTVSAIFYFLALGIPVLIFPGIISLNSIVPFPSKVIYRPLSNSVRTKEQR